MSTVGNSSQPRQAKQGFNYQDYIPSDSEIICPICQVQCTSLQRLNLVSYLRSYMPAGSRWICRYPNSAIEPFSILTKPTMRKTPKARLCHGLRTHRRKSLLHLLKKAEPLRRAALLLPNHSTKFWSNQALLVAWISMAHNQFILLKWSNKWNQWADRTGKRKLITMSALKMVAGKCSVALGTESKIAIS